MRIKLLTVALGCAALLAGGTAAAANAGSVTAGTPTGAAVLTAGRPGTAGAGAHPRKLRPLLRRAEHATVVTSGPRGAVLHAAVRGVVSAVSGTSLTVRAGDSFTLTFKLSTATTRVRVRATPGSGSHPAGGGARVGSLADISRGDHVFALGRSADKARAVPVARLVVVGVRR